MNTLIDAPAGVQTLRDAHGNAAYAVLPMKTYISLLDRAKRAPARALIPHAVVNLMFDGKGMSIARAWREHLELTQAQVAARMGVSQAALAQMESARRPRKATRAKLAVALGIKLEQLVTP